MNIESGTNFGAVYVTAMDGDKPIRSARHMFITAVGPARNTGMEYEVTDEKSELDDAPFWRLKNEGKAPVLLEAVTGKVRIRCPNAAKMKCWTLNIVGKRMDEAPLSVEGDTVTLAMEAGHKTVYYEICAE